MQKNGKWSNLEAIYLAKLDIQRAISSVNINWLWSQWNCPSLDQPKHPTQRLGRVRRVMRLLGKIV